MSHEFFENRLRRAEFTQLRFQLCLDENLILSKFGLLRLRRELNRLLKSGWVAGEDLEQYRNLLHPLVPEDPGVRRRVQQPAPSFILLIDQLKAASCFAGDLLPIEICFLGRGVNLIEPFSRLLETLGQIGLSENQGRFHIGKIENACDLKYPTLWHGGGFHLTPQLRDLTELYRLPPPSAIRLQLITPARLMKNARPLFRADFLDIFPFILRRVTGMCAAWADLEDVFDVGLLIESAARLSTSANRLRWQDWRPLNQEELGGLMGEVILEGRELFDLWPLLKIGELFGLGKGAAFGAGRYRLRGL